LKMLDEQPCLDRHYTTKNYERGGQMTNGYSERDMQIWQEIGRHDERIKDLECDSQAMKDVLQKIYFALAGIAGGVIVSLILLVINLTAGTG